MSSASPTEKRPAQSQVENLNQILFRALELRKELLDYNLQLKEEFLSLISHELRSPLTAVHQFTTIVLDGLAGEVNEQQRKYLSISLQSIRELQLMIDELLTATRARSGALGVRPEMVSMSSVVSESLDALRSLAEEKHIELGSSEEEELPSVYADRRLLGQVLVHLIHNAIKFTSNRGTVHVRTSQESGDSDRLLVEVRDTGCGFSSDLAERVFQRVNEPVNLDSEGRRGLGFGLFICKELVQRQGGRIWVKESPSGGTTLCFTVPVFSIARLVEPVIGNPKRKEDSLELVSIEVSNCRMRQPSARRIDSVRDLLRRRLVPGMEVLLPELNQPNGDRRIRIVGIGEENSGQSARERVEEHLARSKRLQSLGFTYSVSSMPLGPLPEDSTQPRVVSTVARRTAEHLESTEAGEFGKGGPAAGGCLSEEAV